MPYEKFDMVEAIVDAFLSHPDCSNGMRQDRESLKLAVQAKLQHRPKWVKDCDCEERGIYCDCEQLSQR